VAVAPVLQIALSGEAIAADEQQRIERQAEAEQDPSWRECLCWLALFQAARASTTCQVLIAFQ
jgi:hypothetical protein